MAKISNNLLLLATGATLGAIGYLALKHPDKIKEVADNAIAIGEKFLQDSSNKTETINKEENDE